MIRTINPCATARTAEIMSRYRPIAPKPEAPAANSTAAEENDNSALPSGIRKSPYLSNVWAHLQARPTRTRKRGRSAAFGPPPIKRMRYPVTNSPAKNLAMHGFSHAGNGIPQISFLPNFAASMKCGLDAAVTTLAESVAQPLLRRPIIGNGIDLNAPVELEEPVQPRVISPRPVRPVGSCIIVKRIADDPRGPAVAKGAEEVEDALEAEADPAIVSDSNNKVRICNSAYKEMVGQPECCWLDCAGGLRCGGRRIGGEVSLQFVGSKLRASTAAFSCLVEIGWEREGKKFSVNACCSGVKLACEGKDYQFIWRFRTIHEEAD
ncbi:hypothetical protein ACS0TY_024133 [Phlomoides rotata]